MSQHDASDIDLRETQPPPLPGKAEGVYFSYPEDIDLLRLIVKGNKRSSASAVISDLLHAAMQNYRSQSPADRARREITINHLTIRI